MRDDAVSSLRALNEVVERLRAPGGCPWDRAQTHASLRPYLLEETYEVLEAIDTPGAPALREELGDVLLQVLMHCAIAAEAAGEEGFDLGDVADTTRAKMIHRHPHVFGDVTVDGPAAVVVNWERLKRAEKGDRLSVLEGLPLALPALALAYGAQRRPARLGFDETPGAGDAVAALGEALAELAAVSVDAPAAAAGEDWTVTEGEVRRGPQRATGGSAGVGTPPAGAEELVGRLLFEAVALARHLRVNPEDALRGRTSLFMARFGRLEERARRDGADLHDLDSDEWARRWEEAGQPG